MHPDAPSASIHPSLTYADPRAAIDFLCRAFGFTRRLVVDAPDGGVRHSELSLGNGVVFVSGPRPDAGRAAPGALGGNHGAVSVRVDDPDAHHARARAAGAEITEPLADAEHGSRGYSARDPEGHLWHFATYRPGAWWSAQGDDC